MHLHPAQGQHVGLPGLVAPGVDGFGETDFARLRAAVDKFGRVLQDEDRTFARRSRGEMASENAMFGHADCQRSGRPPSPPPSRRTPPGLACPAQLTSDPATVAADGPDACREGPPQKALPPAKQLSLLLVLSRIRDASVIRRHGQNHGRFIRGYRPAHDVGNQKLHRMGTEHRLYRRRG